MQFDIFLTHVFVCMLTHVWYTLQVIGKRIKMQGFIVSDYYPTVGAQFQKEVAQVSIATGGSLCQPFVSCKCKPCHFTRCSQPFVLCKCNTYPVISVPSAISISLVQGKHILPSSAEFVT